eukprot:9091008-Alexandrium_andersonii.AAC.1
MTWSKTSGKRVLRPPTFSNTNARGNVALMVSRTANSAMPRVSATPFLEPLVEKLRHGNAAAYKSMFLGSFERPRT